MRLRDKILEQRAKGLYEALERWKPDHEIAMHVYDLEDAIEESCKIWSELQKGVDRLWEQLHENAIDDTESTGEYFRDVLKILLLATRFVNDIVASCAKKGHAIQGAEDMQQKESEIKTMLARFESDWPWRKHGAEDRAKEDADDDFPRVGTEEWGAMNRRRAELIRKKNREGLTSEEDVEYQRLQRLSQAALERDFPAPPLDQEGLDRLEARLNTAPEAGSE